MCIAFRYARTAVALLSSTAVLVLAPKLPAAQARTMTDALVRDAIASATLGDTASALSLLERATEQSPRDVDALYWRAVVLSRTTGLSLVDSPRRLQAARLLHRAADIDPRNPRYLLELGRLRLNTPLLRVEADRLFQRALTVAERYGDAEQLADVAWELGQIRTRRYLTGKNRWLYTGALAFDPIQSRRLHYTREFLAQLARPIERSGAVDRAEADAFYRRALNAAPRHAPSALALMALLYDQQRFDEMQRVAAPFIAVLRSASTATARESVTESDRNGASVDSSRVLHARVAMAAGLAAYKRGQLAESERLYERALALHTPLLRAELTDIGRILRGGDSVRVAGLSIPDRLRTDSAFWEAADPMLATTENEARLEFLSRIAYSDLFFTDAETRQLGWRTDRGLIVVRYGEPPVIATFAPSSDADAGDALGQVITVWFYPRTETQFVFYGPPAMNSARFAGNYRDFAEERREIAPFLVDNVPMALAVDSLPIQVIRFRGRTARETELVVATSVDAPHLYRNAEIDQGALELSVRVGPAAHLSLVAADTMTVPLPTTVRVRSRWTQFVPVGDYRLRVEARDPSVSTVMARAQNESAMRTFDSTRVDISDLLIADRIDAPTTSPKRWPALQLVPRGRLVMAPRDTFSLYWEVYGLRADAQQRAHFDVDVQITILALDRGSDPVARFIGGVADLVGLSAVGDSQLGLRYERTEPLDATDRVPQLITLGLGTAPPGRYRLSVRITDRQQQASTMAQREFSVSRP
jgi:GWxTD domain-containing protein